MERPRRARAAVDYAALDDLDEEAVRAAGGGGAGEGAAAAAGDASRFAHALHARLPGLGPAALTTLPSGAQLTLPWLRAHGLREPVLIERAAGLGLCVPPRGFAVRDVARVCGAGTPIEVLDVAAQAEVPGSWTLGDWARYFHTPAAERRSGLNVITMEFSGTALARRVRAPRFVRCIDWTDTVFPGFRRTRGEYPLVQLYCLMSVAGSWTDFHLDFGGTSVWYHVHTGAKVFVFLPPTPAALEAYEAWTRDVGATSVQYNVLHWWQAPPQRQGRQQHHQRGAASRASRASAGRCRRARARAPGRRQAPSL
jgi:hypothetical protein